MQIKSDVTEGGAQSMSEKAADRIETQIVTVNSHQPEPELIARAGDVIRSGGTCAFPTETVYGLGADGLNDAAVRKIFKAKGRPGDNPLILHIAEPAQIRRLTDELPEKAERLAQAFWPGPLTMIVRHSAVVPRAATAGLETVGVRCPSNRVANALIRSAGTPIAAPSANLSGSPSPTTGEHVVRDLDGRVDMILMSDDSEIGVESTVVNMTLDPPVILRPGRITKDDLEAVIGPVLLSEGITSGAAPEHPASPGMKYTHYSPRAEVYLAEGTPEEMYRQIMEAAGNGTSGINGVLTTGDSQVSSAFLEQQRKDLTVLSLGDNPRDYEHNLFTALRDLDDAGASRIFVMLPQAADDTLAVRDRLMHSAGYRFLPKKA
ncbi:MAG: L-threonylcarbamoyladenylate synthase [Eubacteriaceae bacterium]|jgi:L-threonylcarbamoyladenylate synthase